MRCLYKKCQYKLLDGIHYSVNDLLQEPLLFDRHHHWARWCDEHASGQIGHKKLFFEDSSHMVIAAKEGLGIALCDPLEIQSELQQKQLFIVSDASITSEQDYYLLLDQSDKLSLRAQLFNEFVQRFFKDHALQAQQKKLQANRQALQGGLL